VAAGKKRDDHRGLIEALRHPLRRDLLRLVIERGEVSPIRAAREVERPVSTVNYHLRELAKEGAVALEDNEPTGGPLEGIYAADGAVQRMQSVREAIGLSLENEGGDRPPATEVESVKTVYDRFAPIYDECTYENNYEMWLGDVLLPELAKHGLQTGWALDVGCGTGRAFEPLLARGWQLVGCDLSSGMLEEAARKFGSSVQLLELDARRLPPISPGPDHPEEAAFDLVLLLNDVINYMTEASDLESIFSGVKRNLNRDHGLFIFDANTLALFRDNFASGLTEKMGEGGWEWRGLSENAEPKGLYEARLAGRGIEAHVHRQRHWPPEQMTTVLEAAGFRCLAALGQREEGGRVLLSSEPDEERDAKVVYIAAPAGAITA
jgi:SAM-dependent methyltransferase/DNA-binding transcriptional ArsR family regulator